MIPGWVNCPPSWRREYTGYLMSTPGTIKTPVVLFNCTTISILCYIQKYVNLGKTNNFYLEKCNCMHLVYHKMLASLKAETKLYKLILSFEHTINILCFAITFVFVTAMLLMFYIRPYCASECFE